MGGSVVACYDNTGMVFAVGCSATQTVSLYACQQADSVSSARRLSCAHRSPKPPFETSQLYDPGLLEISAPPPPITITSLSISNNGEYLLVGTSFDFHYLLDAFHLGVVRRLAGHRPLHERSGAEVSFTADSRYVLSGSADGAVYFWDLGTEKMTAVRKGEDGRPVHAVPILTPAVVVQSSSSTGLEQGAGSRAVRFGPRLCVLAVGGQEVVSGRACMGSSADRSHSGCLPRTMRTRWRRAGEAWELNRTGKARADDRQTGSQRGRKARGRRRSIPVRREARRQAGRRGSAEERKMMYISPALNISCSTRLPDA